MCITSRLTNLIHGLPRTFRTLSYILLILGHFLLVYIDGQSLRTRLPSLVKL